MQNPGYDGVVPGTYVEISAVFNCPNEKLDVTARSTFHLKMGYRMVFTDTFT